MMLTRWSLVRKCLFTSKTKVYILYKRVWSDKETVSRNERGGATSSEVAWEYFGAKRGLVNVTKNDPRILKYLAWYRLKAEIKDLPYCGLNYSCKFLYCIGPWSYDEQNMTRRLSPQGQLAASILLAALVMRFCACCFWGHCQGSFILA